MFQILFVVLITTQFYRATYIVEGEIATIQNFEEGTSSGIVANP